MEDKVLEAARMYLKEPKIEYRLLGGMSNIMVVVSDINNYKYTVRVVGKGAEHFVSREEELYHINLFENLGVTNKTVFFDIKSGVKIGNYIKGEILSNIDPNKHLKEVSDLLKIVHAGPKSKYDYNYFKRLEKYENINDNLPDKYYQLKTEIINYYNKIYKNIKETFTHGDSQPSNFVISDKTYLVDFEFSGNNDPFYDIACYGNKDFNSALKLLEVYLEKKPSNTDLHRLYYNRACQTLQWFLVASYKDKIGLSEDLKIPFDKVSENYLNLTINLLKEMKSFE